jgi:2-polyprenyl-3-methyl-5-hydroxy-6-metoxy-1,4-benzoquinol methylase
VSQAATVDHTEQQPSSCPGCASSDSLLIFRTVGRQSLLCCRRCSLIYIWPAVQQDEPSELYPQTYYAHQPVTWTPGRFPVVRSLVLQHYYGYALPDAVAASVPLWLAGPAARLLVPLKARWRTIPPAVAGGRLLDVGCGSGAYLALVRSLGWSVRGIEPDAEACGFARTGLGLEVSCGTLDDTSLPHDSCDVITLWHTLEHTAQPLRTLQEAHALLRSDGLIMLEVPNWDSVQRRIFSTRWFHLDLPRHLLHFSAHALRYYLVTAGFVDVKVTSVPSTVGITGSLERVLGRRRTQPGVRPWRHIPALKAMFWLPEALLSRAGLAGCLTATARKP